MVRLRVALF